MLFMSRERERDCIGTKYMIFANIKASPQYYMTQRKEVYTERRQRLLHFLECPGNKECSKGSVCSIGGGVFGRVG